MSDLIRKQDTIDALKEYEVVESDNFTRTDPITMMTVGIIAECIEAIVDLPSIESEQKWIPVSEKLPKDSETVLITHKGGVSFGWYNGSYWERGASTKHRPLQTVIAWMPLPEPWQGE